MKKINNIFFNHELNKPREPLLRYFSAEFLLLFFVLFHLSLPLCAQEEISDSAHNEASRQRTEMEIRTSTLSELALWCRALGLSEGGTRAELSARLREYFNLPEGAQKSDHRIVTIESAQTSEYFTIDVIGEEYARLSGNVSLSMIDGDTTHKIRADEILFNRTRNIITARGKVTYIKNTNDSTETFRGENITVNLDSWSSVILDGNSAFELEGDRAAYLFSGRVISHSDEDVTVLTDAVITNALNEEALWSINASKIWLLPGTDFAVFNAVLRVGVIPVLYLPFFYFPGDQLIFHPVIGYRSREGGYVQTTTYIFGQSESSSEDAGSISRILGNSDNTETEREGLFLRSTGKKRTDPDEINMKIMADYYVNLGIYLGLDLSLPKNGILNPIGLSFGIGFSKTVSMIDGNYTPYTRNNGIYDGSVEWNKSNLFSLSVPFRYRMRTSSSVTWTQGSLSWNFPFYSDPFIDGDFLNRSEQMDWADLIQQGNLTGNSGSSQSEIRSYQWQVNGNYNPSLPSLSPYISKIALSHISTTLSFRTINDSAILANNRNSPSRSFFAPDKLTIYHISGSITGNPFSYGANTGRTSSAGGSDQYPEDPLNGIGSPITPWQKNESGSAQRSVSGGDPLSPPVLNQSFSLPGTGNITYGIDYQVSPSSSAELQFMTGSWTSYDQVNWSETQSLLVSAGGNSNINFRVNHSSGLFTNVITFSGSGTLRDYGFLNEDAFLDNSGKVDQSRIDTVRRQQYSQTNYSSAYSYNGSVRPFIDNLTFSQTNFQYNFRGTLLRSKRYSAASSPDGPELTPQWGSWVKEESSEGIYGLSSHRLAANIAANVMGREQSVSVSMDIPPLDWVIDTRTAFRFWISETNINFRIERPLSADWVFKPVYFTETLRFNSKISLVYNMVLKPEENNDVTNIGVSLSLWNFRASFTAEKARQYVFKQDSTPWHWVQEGDPVLGPKQLSFSYTDSFPELSFFKNRLLMSFDINTSLNIDLQRYTNSNFQLALGLKLNIPGLFEITMTSTSYNNSIWRYFEGAGSQNASTKSLPYYLFDAEQKNLFIDFFNSFNFFDESKRRKSGFKIQKFELLITHFLGDWNAELGVSMYPYQRPDKNFEITADIRFMVHWKPITEIKTDFRYDGRQDRWESR